MNIFLYIMTVCVWGSTWFTITYQLGTVPADVSIFYRYALASTLLLGWCFVKRLNMKFSLKNHMFFAAQGFFLFSMNYWSAYEATYYIPSGLNAIGFSMVLVFNIINSAIFYRTPLTLPIVVGASCGMVGILTIFWPSISTLDLTSTALWGVFFSLFAGLLASFGNIISVQNQKESIPVTESNAYGMVYGTLWMLVLILYRGSPFTFEMTTPYVLSLIHLSVFGSIVAFGCYLTLLGRIGASKAAYALVITPVVALVLSTLFEDFVWETNTLVGVGLILLGNVIIQARKSSKERPQSLSLKPA